MWTSDAAQMVTHEIDPDGWVTACYGSIFKTLVGGISIEAERANEIAPPAEQHFPRTIARDLDAEYTEAAFEVLRRGDDRARRVRAAIDWLDLAWRNTTSITEPMRIVMLKSGFESLLA